MGTISNRTLLVFSATAISFLLMGCEANFQSFGTAEFEKLSQQCLTRNSQKSYQETGVQSLNPNKKVILPQSILHETVTIQNGVSKVSLKVAADTPLAVLINNSCAQLAEKTSFSKSIISHSSHARKSGLQAYPVQLSGTLSIDQLREQVAQDDCVLKVTDNKKMKMLTLSIDDPAYNKQTEYLDPIKAQESWKLFHHSLVGVREEIVVAVIDTGVDYRHEDLKNRMWQKDGRHGYDTVNDDNDPMDDQGHGTMVSGFIAAEPNNDVGIKGLMHNHVKIMALKALDSRGSGSAVSVADAIIWAADNGADIINMSLGGRANGGSTGSNLIDDAIDHALSKNVVIINAAGNDGMTVDNDGFWPANNGNKPGFVVVAATRAPNKSRANFSNYGNSRVHIAAPGASATHSRGILTTARNNNYDRANGTSFASPIVAGAAALAVSLVKTRGDQFTNASIEQLLMDSAEKVSGLKNTVRDGNYLNMVQLASNINETSTSWMVEAPKNQHVLVAEDAVLSVSMTSSKVTYQWMKNGAPIPGATSSELVISNAQFRDRGSYRVKISQEGQPDTISSPVSVEVYAKLCEN